MANSATYNDVTRKDVVRDAGECAVLLHPGDRSWAPDDLTCRENMTDRDIAYRLAKPDGHWEIPAYINSTGELPVLCSHGRDVCSLAVR